jgi:hypothetical protein
VLDIRPVDVPFVMRKVTLCQALSLIFRIFG